jgi:hypothetical protein
MRVRTSETEPGDRSICASTASRSVTSTCVGSSVPRRTSRLTAMRPSGSATWWCSAMATRFTPEPTFTAMLSGRKPADVTRSVRRPPGNVNVARPDRSVAPFAVPVAMVAPEIGMLSAVTRTTTVPVMVWPSAVRGETSNMFDATMLPSANNRAERRRTADCRRLCIGGRRWFTCETAREREGSRAKIARYTMSIMAVCGASLT